MASRVLVVVGHPRAESFCGALGEAYARGARGEGAEVRVVQVGEIDFAVAATRGFDPTELEPDLVSAQADIAWADHLVFVYPTWWATIPALLKGFIERTFTPGFAYQYRDDSPLWDRLLSGRSARLVATMDTPPSVYRVMFRSAGHHTMKRGILGFCGVKPVQITALGSVRSASESRRRQWLDKVEQLGAQDASRTAAGTLRKLRTRLRPPRRAPGSDATEPAA